MEEIIIGDHFNNIVKSKEGYFLQYSAGDVSLEDLPISEDQVAFLKENPKRFLAFILLFDPMSRFTDSVELTSRCIELINQMSEEDFLMCRLITAGDFEYFLNEQSTFLKENLDLENEHYEKQSSELLLNSIERSINRCKLAEKFKSKFVL